MRENDYISSRLQCPLAENITAGGNVGWPLAPQAEAGEKHHLLACLSVKAWLRNEKQ